MDLQIAHKGSTTGMPKDEFVKWSLESTDLKFADKVALITGGTGTTLSRAAEIAP
jgi:hypothetical protein